MMRWRYLLLIPVILGPSLIADEARAAHVPAHGRDDAREKPTGTAQGAAGQDTLGQDMISSGLVMPAMDPARGRMLFASKGCVVCHSVNSVGGRDAPPLDAATMRRVMNPFEFVAKMWRGAEAMIALQRDELGEQIELTGDEIADIIAFAHDPAEQRKFSAADIPARVKVLMTHMKESEPHEEERAPRGHMRMH